MRNSIVFKPLVKILIVGHLWLFGIAPGAASADNYAQLLQVEITFGGQQPVSNFYISSAAGGAVRTQTFDSDLPSIIRTPVFSTDRSRLTMFNLRPVLYENDTNTDSGQEGDEKPGAFGAIGSILLMGLLLAPAIYSVSKNSTSLSELDRAGAEAACGDGRCVVEDFPTAPATTPGEGG